MTLPTEDQIYQIIGNKIREARIRLGLSQSKLAEDSDLARTTLTNIENGAQKIPIHVLYKLASILHVPINDLLLDSGEKPVDVASLLEKKVITTNSGSKDLLAEEDMKRILNLVKKQRRQGHD